jgi:hypothetical protein
VARTLTDQAWADICAAAGRTPDAGTRERLSKVLFEEYQVFAYDREDVKAALRRGESMLKHLGAFAELYRQAWFPHLPEDQVEAIFAGRPSAGFDDKNIERDCWSIAKLRQRAEAAWLAARFIRQAHSRHGNVQQEWLITELCTCWIWDFHQGEALSYSIPPKGGEPSGPLIDFLSAAIREVTPGRVPLNAFTLRDAILRQRRERENAKQLGFRFPPLITS